MYENIQFSSKSLLSSLQHRLSYYYEIIVFYYSHFQSLMLSVLNIIIPMSNCRHLQTSCQSAILVVCYTYNVIICIITAFFVGPNIFSKVRNSDEFRNEIDEYVQCVPPPTNPSDLSENITFIISWSARTEIGFPKQMTCARVCVHITIQYMYTPRV